MNMIGHLLVLRKTYDVVNKKCIDEWYEDDIDFASISIPKNFELRAIEAALDGKSLSSTFSELTFTWTDRDAIINTMHKYFVNSSWYVVVVYFEKLHIALHVANGINVCRFHDAIKCNSIEELRNILNEH